MKTFTAVALAVYTDNIKGVFSFDSIYDDPDIADEEARELADKKYFPEGGTITWTFPGNPKEAFPLFVNVLESMQSWTKGDKGTYIRKYLEYTGLDVKDPKIISTVI